MAASKQGKLPAAMVIALAGVLMAVLPSAPAGAVSTTVVINEVQTTTGATRWLELANLTGSAIELGGYSLELTTFSGFQPLAGTLPANGHFVVCLASAADSFCDLAITQDLAMGTDGVRLYAGISTVVDTVGWEGSAIREGVNEGVDHPRDPGANATLGRCADGLDTDENSVDFQSSTPTPGAPNFCPALVVNEVNYAASPGDRFFEVHNPATQPVSLAHYLLVWIAEGGGRAGAHLPDTTIAAGGFHLQAVPLEDGPAGAGLTPRYGGIATLVDSVTWGGGGQAADLTEGSDAELIDPDAGPSPTGTQGLSRCGADSDVNSEDFVGLPLTRGTANACPNLLVNEVDYNVPGGGTEFVEVVNRGTAPVDLFDYRFLVHTDADTLGFGLLNARGTTVAAGGRATLCLGTAGPAGCPTIAASPSIHDGPGGVVIVSRWSQAGLAVTTWQGGGQLGVLEAGPPTSMLRDQGAEQSISRCPDGMPSAGTLAGFRVAVPSPAAANACSAAALLLNEVAHAGSADFVELLNPTTATVSLEGWELVVDPPRSVIELTGSLPAGAYTTVCLGSTGCTRDVPGASLPDGPSGVALRSPADDVVDALSWGNGGVAPDTLAEGGATTQLIDSGEPEGNSLSRCPDGGDSDVNAADFSLQARSRGLANPCTGPVAPAGQQWRLLTGDPTQLSIALSQLAGELGLGRGAAPPPEVLLASDTVFADALASGSLQATRPLLLNDPAALEDAVLAEIQRLGATTVRILGGESAISTAVADALTAAGLTIVRTSGPTRLETAEQIAQLAGPTVDTALVARAFPAAGGDDTQAFADSLAAGGWAAATGWPVLLSQTEVLSDTTRTYLDASAVATARVIGGEAALSAAVTDALGGLGIGALRTAGATRFDTATAIAGAAGFGPSTPASTVILVEGQAAQAWAAGFTAARFAALMGAPIVLANGDALPEATQTFLAQSVAPAQDGVALVCLTTAGACAAAVATLGL